jgi:tRNA U34 5-carboxymethylaminomethyl modifying enzyme MnmG/GidA
MKAASLKEIKNELDTLRADELVALALRLSKYKKENKELLTYLLFEASDEVSYLNAVKMEIDSQLLNLNTKNLHLAKKTIRKLVRTANKYIKYSGNEQTEIEILIHLSHLIKNTKLDFSKSVALTNIYNALLKKIHTAIKLLHEDLQYDFLKKISSLDL